MAEKLTDQPTVTLANLARVFPLWIAKTDEAAGTQDRQVLLGTLAEYFSGGAIPIEQTAHGFSVGDAVRHDGSSYAEATADSEVNARVSGVVVEVVDSDNFWLQGSGYASTFSGLTAGNRYYLQDAGGYGTTAGTVEVPLFDATSATEAWLIALGGAGGASTSGVLEFTVRNDTGSTITAGTLVEIHDATASQIRVRPADKDTSVSADGIAIEDIASNSEGDIRVGGTYSGVDTSGLTEGDPIWLGDDGGFVDSAPTSGAVIRVGKVGIVAASGSIALRLPAFEAHASETAYDNASSGLTATDVKAALDEVAAATGSGSLDNLSDVNAPSPSDGQVLTWVDANSAWEPTAASGVSDFTGLDDTPGSYSSGDGGKHLAVNSAENAVEFVDPAVVSVNAQTGTSYTLVASDAGKVVELTNASAITLTVPPNSSVAFAVGTIIAIEQGGAGTVTVSPGSGVTINSFNSNTDLAGESASAALRKDATDTWVLTGNLA